MSTQYASIADVAPISGTSVVDLRVIPQQGTPAQQLPTSGATAPQVRRQRPWISRLARSAVVVALVDIAALVVWPAVVGIDAAWITVSTALTLALFADAAMYRRRLHWSVLDDLPSLLGRSMVAVAAVAAGSTVLVRTDLPLGGLGGLGGLGRGVDAAGVADLFGAGLVTIALVLVGRCGTYALVRYARRSGLVEHRTLIVGSGDVAGELATLLTDNRELGLLPVGYIDNVASPALDMGGLAHLGGSRDIGAALSRTGATVMLLTTAGATDDSIVDIVRSPAVARCEVLIVPRLFELMNLREVNDHIGAIPVVRLRRPSHLGMAVVAKRAFDIVFGTLAVIGLAPVLVACAIAVRTTGPGVIFRQPRVGKAGRLFDLYKFRSMRPADEGLTSTQWSGVADPRMTVVGRILRRTSLDELPQLWNILRGDMTIVGPRPERPHFAEQFSREFRHYAHRHRVPVGLTGMAQVNGLRGSESSISLRARYDNYYIENWSLWGDVKVILRTVREVARATGS